MRELFQFDSADLDFGIYRIMNHKRDVIERFITQDLPKTVAAELDRGALAEQSQVVQELQDIATQIRQSLSLDALDASGNLVKHQDTELGRKYLSLKSKAADGRSRDAFEKNIFNHLNTFFSRYYRDGDFISQRRYSKRERYAIPYNGEEIYLYWANHDQYYVKTAEQFTDYTFNSRGVTVHFKLQTANVEQNNVKGEKRFFLSRSAEIVWDEAASQLVIPFEYRPLTGQEEIIYGQKNQQDIITAKALAEIPKRLSLKTGAPALAALQAERRMTSNGQPVTHLEHHLRQYTRSNTSDYFIHKDLQGFLCRELDFYLKNEVLNLDELEAAGEDRAEGWFQIMRVIKAVGSRIIDFLTQIEEFQKMLWEKRKFIAETHYCITVGNIAETFYPEIAACDLQWNEWQELCHIDEEQADLFTIGENKQDRRIAFLQNHPTLALDTKHFDRDLVDRLLGSFDDLDEMTDGLLIHSENWQALNLLAEKYRNKVRCSYIDPPYNTASSAIPYKNNYKHSSFASMMYDRVAGLWRTLTKDGALFVSIDKTERTVVAHVLDEIFGGDNRIEELIWAMNTNNSQAPNYSTNHEYVLVYAKNRSTVEQDRNMFREPKPGYEEVMELVTRLNPDYPAVAQIEQELRQLYEQHRIALRNEMEARGLDWEEEQSSDPWKGLYNYTHVEYRDVQGRLIPENEAKAKQAWIWVWQEGDASMPATKQSPTTRDPNHKNYRFYRPPHPVTGRPCPHPKSGWKFAYDDDEDSPERRSFVSLDRDNRIA